MMVCVVFILCVYNVVAISAAATLPDSASLPSISNSAKSLHHPAATSSTHQNNILYDNQSVKLSETSDPDVSVNNNAVVVGKDSAIYLDEDGDEGERVYPPGVTPLDPHYGTSIPSNATKKLPDVIIIGVKKGGTRALLEFLKIHPRVRATGPEPHFFDRNYDKGLDWYREQMPPTTPGQLTVEKTPSYFVTREVPRRVYNMSKNTKLIVVVRDPVVRAISDYTQTAAKKPGMQSFEQMALLDNRTGLVNSSWGAVRIGVYPKHLDRWLEHFPLRQFHFVSGERLISDPAGVMTKLQDFLRIERLITKKHFFFDKSRGFPCIKKTDGKGRPHCLGKTKGRQHPVVDPHVIHRLRDFYTPFNFKFYRMVGQNFRWPQ